MVSYGLVRPGKLLLPGPCLLGPASSSCRGPCLLGPASSSCQGPCLLGPASSSCQGPCLECLVFSWRFRGGPCRRVLQLPVHKSGVLRYPYFSTPTVMDTSRRNLKM